MRAALISTALLALAVTSASAEDCIYMDLPCKDYKYFFLQPGESKAEFWGRWPNTVPPTEYDHPFAGRLTISHPEKMPSFSFCPPSPWMLGCTLPEYPDKDSCTIILVLSNIAAVPWPYEVVLRHEIAHCNGQKGHDGSRALNAQEIEKLLRGEQLVPWVPREPSDAIKFLMQDKPTYQKEL